jgi:inosose dehydratase
MRERLAAEPIPPRPMRERLAAEPIPPRPMRERLAGAPISWGVCEVPGWGPMPPVEPVLGEMAKLGLRGTELGAPGFLPDDPAALSELLTTYGLELVGGFVPLALHDPKIDAAIELARRAASLLARAGGQVFVLALVEDSDWSPPRSLDDTQWRRLAAHVGEIVDLVGAEGMTVALHPHAGTLIETAEQIGRAVERLDVGWCLDPGHLLIGGVDPARFAREHGDRVVHVHLKDVDGSIAEDLRAGRCSLLEATRRGLFVTLGAGDAGIDRVLQALETHGYDGWLVLEQDTAITEDEPTVGRGPMLDAPASIDYLEASARPTQEVN